MSGFLSDKYLRYRAAADFGTVDEDTPCPQCGYNLRGLPVGRACPECGGETLDAHSSTRRRSPLFDAMLHGDEAARNRWKIGLTLAICVLIGVILARIVMFGVGFQGFTREILIAYFTFGGALTVVWLIAVIMLMPPTLHAHWPWMRNWRRAVLISQAFWMIGYAAMFIKLTTGPGAAGSDIWQFVQLASRGIAGIGFIIFGFLMTYIAEEAELEPGWQRLNTATWLLPLPTIIAMIYPTSIPWIILATLGFVLIWWAWMLMLFTLGLLQMRQHVAWGMRYVVDGTERMARISEKRAALDAEVRSKVRPVRGKPVTKPTSYHQPKAAQTSLVSPTSAPEQQPIPLDTTESPSTPGTSAANHPRKAQPDDGSDLIPLAGDETDKTLLQPSPRKPQQSESRTPEKRKPGTSLWDAEKQ